MYFIEKNRNICILDNIFIFSIVPLVYTILIDINFSLGYIVAFIIYILLSCFFNRNMNKKYKKTYLIINILISPIFLYLSIFISILIVDKLNIDSDFIFQILIFVPTGLLLILSTKYITKYIQYCCIEEDIPPA